MGTGVVTGMTGREMYAIGRAGLGWGTRLASIARLAELFEQFKQFSPRKSAALSDATYGHCISSKRC